LSKVVKKFVGSEATHDPLHGFDGRLFDQLSNRNVELMTACPKQRKKHCRRCHRPSLSLPVDDVTEKLISTGTLATKAECPFIAVNLGLMFTAFDAAKGHRQTRKKLERIRSNLRHSMQRAKKVIERALDDAEAAYYDPLPEVTVYGEPRATLRGPTFEAAVQAEISVSQAIEALSTERFKNSGRIGRTRNQSLVEGMLVAWESCNGRFPSDGNTKFQHHLESAFQSLKLDTPLGLPKAIRQARTRLASMRSMRQT
jgi:hypothetical protein